MKAVQPVWHEFTAEFNFADGLDPHFAAYSLTSETGSKHAEFTASGERWIAKLYSQDSNILHPGQTTHTGTPWEFETMREFRIHIVRHPDEDEVGKQKLNAHMRPRWQGMVVESSDGSRSTLSIPDDIEEGVNLRASGANIDAHRYQGLIRAAAGALDMNPGYFRDAHDSSSVQDGERYVRIYEDAAGPIHARDGPIANLGHLLENDRSGYRKIVQNDGDIHGRQLPGYYHTVTLGPRRIREAFPTHSAPVEIKHYYAREAQSLPEDHPLSHPKLGVSYQVSRWDGKVGVTVEDLDELERQLDRTLHAVLEDAFEARHRKRNPCPVDRHQSLYSL